MTEHRCKTRLKKKVDFYTRVVATTPQDRSSRYSIWRYGERTFQHAHCVIFGVFASGRRSGGPLFIDAGVLTLKFSYYELLANLIFEIRHRNAPSNIHRDLFQDISDIHCYNTRSSACNNF